VAKVLENITGQPPPTWTCPCGTSDDYILFIKTYANGTLTCQTTVWAEGQKTIDINDQKYTSLVFSFYPGSYPKQSCGFFETSKFVLTDDQASACVGEIKTAAELLGIVCR
ncbi:MAG TPA: hypothetical protein VF853_09195, partial [Candidatus Deferrimicrobiaceae bacterium]